jgi:hypothetical protein
MKNENLRKPALLSWKQLVQCLPCGLFMTESFPLIGNAGRQMMNDGSDEYVYRDWLRLLVSFEYL